MNALRLGLVALLGSWAGGCGGSTCDCDTPEPAVPKVTSLEADLGEVQVSPMPGPKPDRAFQLIAWYRDAGRHIVSGRFPAMHWSFDPSGEGTAEDGSVTVTQFPTSAFDNATVRAEKEGEPSINDEVKVTRWANSAAAAAKGDVVEADHTPGKRPAVVLLEENESSTCGWGSALAFVGAAGVGEQTQNPCSLSLLSADHAMLFAQPGGLAPPTWLASPSWGGTGSIRALSPLSARKTLNLQVFIAVTGRTASILSGIPLSNSAQLAKDVAAAAEAQAKVDVDWADMIFEASRTGLAIVADFKQLDPATMPDLEAQVGAQPYDCIVPRSLPSVPATLSYAYEPNKITVYYVDWIDYPTDPLHPGSRGIGCAFWDNGVPGPIIYVSYTRHSSVTLAHELGHVLGLNDEEAALGEINVMHNLAPDGSLGADARSLFTVGQVFRMNIWENSWIAVPTSVPVKRFCDAAQPCPPVTIDAQ